MTRRLLTVVALLTAGFATGYFSSRRPAPPRIEPPNMGEISRRVLPRVELHATTISGALQYARDLTGLDTASDWASADEKSLTDTPFDPDLSFHDVTVGQFIGRLNASTPRTSWRKRFDYSDGFLTALDDPETPTDFGEDEEARSGTTTASLYNVESLIAADGPWEKLAIAPQDFTAKPPFTMAQRRVLLENTIMELVDSTQWRNTGGNIGSLRIIDGQSLVNQTNPNQRAIYEVIKALRAAK